MIGEKSAKGKLSYNSYCNLSEASLQGSRKLHATSLQGSRKFLKIEDHEAIISCRFKD